MKRSLTLSLAVHLTLIALMVGFPKGCGGGGGDGKDKRNKGDQGNPDKDHIIDKVVEVEIVEPKDGIGKEKPKPKQKPKPKPTEKAPEPDCKGKGWFGGIGVTVLQSKDGSISLVDKVHAGYPAEKAGILRGDWLVNFPKLRGDPGTSVVVTVIRDGKTGEITITRDKICTEPEDTAK